MRSTALRWIAATVLGTGTVALSLTSAQAASEQSAKYAGTTGVSLTGTRPGGVSLTSTDPTGVSLTGVSLTGVSLTRTTHS